MSSIRWLAMATDAAEEATLKIGRSGDEVIAEWPGIARLVARRDGSEARLEGDPDADPRYVRKIEQGSARLLVRHLQGKPAFHGAAIAIGEGAVVFLGRSGQGKSSLAAACCTTVGARLLADDAVFVDRADGAWMVTPGEEDHWLDGTARRALGRASEEDETKAPVAAPAATTACPLRAIFDLCFAETDEVVTRRLNGIDAVAALVPQAVRFAIDEEDAHRRELDRIAALVADVPIYRLERPRGFARMAECVRVVTSFEVTGD